MNVSYRVTRRDVFFSLLHAAARNRFQTVFLIILASLMTMLMFVDPALRKEAFGYKAIYFIASVVFTLLLAALGMIVVACGMAFLRPLRGIVGTHFIELTNEGILESTEINESLHRWSGIRRIRRAGSYLQVYVTEIAYHSIPLSAFETPELAEAFLQEVKNRAKAAQPVAHANAGS